MISAKLVAEYLEHKDGHLGWVKRPPGPTKNVVVNYTKNLQRKSYD